MTKPLIEISGLYKIFGPKPKTVIERVKQGRAKTKFCLIRVIPLV